MTLRYSLLDEPLIRARLMWMAATSPIRCPRYLSPLPTTPSETFQPFAHTNATHGTPSLFNSPPWRSIAPAFLPSFPPRRNGGMRCSP